MNKYTLTHEELKLCEEALLESYNSTCCRYHDERRDAYAQKQLALQRKLEAMLYERT